MGTLLAKMTSRPKLRVLCFGDSLTAGYASWGAVHHPYNEKLEEMLSMAFPDLKIETEEDGLSGATVKHGFQTRMNAQCEWFSHSQGPFVLQTTSKRLTKLGVTVQTPTQTKKKKDDEGNDGKRYDWAIVLGGTKYASPNPSQAHQS